MQPYGTQDTRYQQFIRELDERHFRQFPESKRDLELKQELYSRGIFGDELLAIYQSSDNCYPGSSMDSSSSHLSSPLLSASSLGSSPLAATLGYAPGHFGRGPPNLSTPHGSWSQIPGHIQPPLLVSHFQASPTNLSTPPPHSVGISATPFQWSSLAPVTSPFEDKHRLHAHQGVQLQYPSVPTVPSNGPSPQERAPQSPSYHQSNSSSLSGWAEPPPMRPLNDPDVGYKQYQLDVITVPSNSSPDHPIAMPTSPQYYLDQVRPSSSNQALQLLQSPGLGTSYIGPASSSSASTSESATAPSTWAPHLPGTAAGPDDSPSPSVESLSDEEPPTMTLPIAPAAKPESPRSTRGNRPVKNGEKKPPLACLFCRGRKIACGPPVPDGDDHTCNQCHRRGLKCEYPAESRRGMRRKRSSSDLDGDARDFKRSSSKSQRRG